MIKKTKTTFTAVVILVLVFFVYQRLKPKQNDYEYLKKLPQHIAELVEKKLAGEVKRFVAKDYSDQENRTYQDISGLITLHALQEGEASIYVVAPQVEIDSSQNPNKATLSFKAAMARGPKDAGALNVIPESASLYSFTVHLQKTEEGWLIKSASWQREPVP
ncbi:hypothetical protein K2P97_12745 [bacterium]|nr:hypothetical protein [bacterium]